jgi:hypothetical protein
MRRDRGDMDQHQIIIYYYLPQRPEQFSLKSCAFDRTAFAITRRRLREVSQGHLMATSASRPPAN